MAFSSRIPEPKIFMKFMSGKYVDSFVNEGLLYMNNLKYFKEIEGEDSDSLRGDPDEGVIANYNAESISYAGITLKPSDGKVKMSYAEDEKINIFCFTTITENDIKKSEGGMLKLSEEFIKFGDKVIFIKDPKSFFDKLELEIFKQYKNKKIKYLESENRHYAKKVEYYNKNESNYKLGAFKKPSAYSWQHEWRVVVEQIASKGPFELRIGNLEDVVMVLDTEQAIKMPMPIPSLEK